MRWRVPLVILALLVAVSCDQQPVEPQDHAAVAAPVLNFTNGPEQPGNSFIAREAGWNPGCFWCETTDPPGSRLYALHYQADDVNFCGGASDSGPPWDYQGGVNNGGVHYLNQTSDQPIFLYDMDDLLAACSSFPEPCCTFLATDWLYKGTHDMTVIERYQDNSSYTQLMGNGFVYDQDGNRYRYREHQMVVYEDGGGTTWPHEDIIVH